MRLSALSPFGPIFAKELRTTARRKRTYLLRFLYLVILLVVLWGIYIEVDPGRDYDYDGSVAHRAQKTAELGAAFFGGFSMFCVIGMALIAPILTATSINAERMSKTLNVLLMTPITSWQIVSGKLMSRLLAAFTLIGLSLPVLAVVRLLGGVDLDRMLTVLALCVVTTFFTAALGLFYSTFTKRAYAVILLAYATELFLYLFVPFVLALIIEPRGNRTSWFFHFMAAINPFFMTAFEAIGGSPFRGLSAIPTIIVHLVGTIVLMLWSASVLRRLTRNEGEKAGFVPLEPPAPHGHVSVPPPPPLPPAVVPASVTALSPPGDTTIAPVPPPPPLAVRPLDYRTPTHAQTERTVGDNPVLWREIRQPLTRKKSQAVTFSILAIGLLLLTYVAVGSSSRRAMSRPDTQIGYAFIFCGLLTLLTCVIAATGIACEKESDTWTLLMATPMSARAIVLGKLAGQFRRMMWPTIFILIHFLLFTIGGVLSVASFVLIVWILVSFNTIWVATGLYLSLRVRKVTLAVIFNLLMPIAAFPLMMLLLVIIGNTFDSRDLGEAVGWYAPYVYLASAIEGFSNYRYSGGFWLPFSHSRATADEFMMTVLVAGIGQLLLTAGLVAYTIARFDKIVGRSPQTSPLSPAAVDRPSMFAAK